jgi:hypothetical protein
MLTFSRRVRSVLWLVGKFGKAGCVMVLGRRNRKNKKVGVSTPRYIRTAERDGRKYVDLDEFVQDKEIRRQFKQLAEQAGRR